MKQYERMSKEEIDNAYYFSKGNCSECMAKHYCNDITARFTCVETVHDWLQKEIKIKKVHRWELIKSDDDLNNAQKKWDSHCKENGKYKNCKECRYSNGNELVPTTAVCFTNFLKEEIEIEVEE